MTLKLFIWHSTITTHSLNDFTYVTFTGESLLTRNFLWWRRTFPLKWWWWGAPLYNYKCVSRSFWCLRKTFRVVSQWPVNKSDLDISISVDALYLTLLSKWLKTQNITLHYNLPITCNGVKECMDGKNMLPQLSTLNPKFFIEPVGICRKLWWWFG